MIETSNPEIDVNQLMERMRQEAAKIRPRENSNTRPSSPARRSVLPIIPEIAAPPSLGLSRGLDPKMARTETRLEKARRMIEARGIPKMFHRFFRRQGGFNRATLETMTELAKTNVQLNKRVRELTTTAEQQNQWLRTLVGQRQTESAWMKAAGSLLANISPIQETITHLESLSGARADEIQANLDQLRESLRVQQDGAERFGSHLRNLQAQANQQGELQQAWHEDVSRYEEHLRHLQTASEREAEQLRGLREQLDRHGEHLRNLQGATELQTERLARIAHLEASMNRLEDRHLNESIYLKGELSRHNALLQQSVSADGSEAELDTRSVTATDSHRFDSFYLAFENRFRGSRSEIKERVQFYLPLITEAKAGAHDRPILDLGCGRGEWLELLQENGLKAAGVDLSDAMVAHCQQRNLAAAQADAVEYLRSLPDSSLGAVSGFHIIEHLPFETLMDLLGQTRRVLQSGGLALFESPNCKNIVVGASNFYSDPTHRNPVFPDTAAFMLETHGFERVRLEYLLPVDHQATPSFELDRADFQNWFYGPRDFAVVGYKP